MRNNCFYIADFLFFDFERKATKIFLVEMNSFFRKVQSLTGTTSNKMLYNFGERIIVHAGKKEKWNVMLRTACRKVAESHTRYGG